MRLSPGPARSSARARRAPAPTPGRAPSPAPPLPAQDGQRRRPEGEQPAVLGWQAQPPSREDPQAVAMAEGQDIPIPGSRSRDHTVHPHSDAGDRLAISGPFGPDRPAGSDFAD